MADALALIDAWIATGARRYVCVTGVHGVMESQIDPALRDIHNSCRARHAGRHAAGVDVVAPRAPARGEGLRSRSDACLL